MWSLNKRKSKLTLLIETFLKSKERNIQLDFYRKNGEVLIQLFKGYDVNLWDIDMEAIKKNDTVYQLLFHKDKTNNDENIKRFESSFLFSDFKKVEFYNQNTYFYVQSANFSQEVENKIIEILNEVYDLGSNRIKFTLNAY